MLRFEELVGHKQGQKRRGMKGTGGKGQNRSEGGRRERDTFEEPRDGRCGCNTAKGSTMQS